MGIMGYILRFSLGNIGLYRDNGKENGYYSILVKLLFWQVIKRARTLAWHADRISCSETSHKGLGCQV